MYELNCRWFLLIAVKFPKSTGRDQDDQAILATGVSISKDKISFAPRWSTHTHTPTHPQTRTPTDPQPRNWFSSNVDVPMFASSIVRITCRWSEKTAHDGGCDAAKPEGAEEKTKIAEGLWFSCKLMMFLSWILIYFPELSGESSLGCPGNCVFLG